MFKHIFFDMDGTLSASRAQMLEEHFEPFLQICAQRTIIVITGQDMAHMRWQVPVPQIGNYYALSQQGNHAVHKDGHELWRERVTEEQEVAVKSFALELTNEFLKKENLTLLRSDDIFENRESLLASSVVGFHAPNELKYRVDPDQSKRRALLTKHAKEVQTLHDIGIEVMPAGTTTYDFILKGKNKGYNVARLIEHEKWERKDCVYVGDALFPGGNDESVIGVIGTHEVQSPTETFEFIQKYLT